MLSAISSHGKVYFTFSKESINQDKLIDFFERLIKDVKHPIFMILDNLRAHHSKKVTAWVKVLPMSRTIEFATIDYSEKP